jgi:hypothetical protein
MVLMVFRPVPEFIPTMVFKDYMGFILAMVFNAIVGFMHSAIDFSPDPAAPNYP